LTRAGVEITSVCTARIAGTGGILAAMPETTGEPARAPPDRRLAAVILPALDAALLRFEARCRCDGKWCDWCLLRRDLDGIARHLERMVRGR
jgi:hypothetical protein